MIERIKYLRENKDLKQAQLADYLNIDRTTYTSYEIERDPIPIKHLNKLCNYFHISIDYALNLTDLTSYPNIKSEINNTLLNARLRDLRKKNNLTQKQIAKMLKISRSSWINYETKDHIIPTLTIYELSIKYNYSIDYLLGKTDFPININKKKK